MSETDFLEMADDCLRQVEEIFEQAFENDELDWWIANVVGTCRNFEFVNNGSKIIVNSQAAMQEMWLKARSGGFHYRHDGNSWLTPAMALNFFATLSKIAHEQGQIL